MVFKRTTKFWDLLRIRRLWWCGRSSALTWAILKKQGQETVSLGVVLEPLMHAIDGHISTAGLLKRVPMKSEKVEGLGVHQ